MPTWPEMVGALLPMFVFSRIALALAWFITPNGLVRVWLANGLALGIGVLLAGFGYADGGAPKFLHALLLDTPAVLVLLLIDQLFIFVRRARIKRRLTQG